jgi:hypothetical protein
MTRSKPPALAIRLMNETMTDPAVIGDMVEEHAKGRTAWWFWKQAIAAAAPSPLSGLRWAIAIPLAYGTAALVGGNLPWMTFDVGRTLVGPLWTACLVFTAVWIVPSRKLFVAKALLGLVSITCAVFLAYSGYRWMGRGPVGEATILLRVLARSTLMGAVAGYAVAHYFCRAPLDLRPTLDDGPWTMD